jgi:hypothetical protein
MFGGFNKSFQLGKRGITSPSVITVPDTTGTTEVSWTDDTYFDFYSSQTSTTTDILASVQNRCFQLCYAHQQVTIPNDGISRLAVGTYSTQVSSPKRWWMAIGVANDIQRVPQSYTSISSDSDARTSSQGAFVEIPCRATGGVTIPANRWFIIGHSIIPFRAVRSQAAARTAVIGGTYYVTAFPILYEFGSQSELRTPVQLGGYGRPVRVWSGYTHVMSIKFKL